MALANARKMAISDLRLE